MPSLSEITTWVGVILVLHSAFSCQQYRGLVSAMELQGNNTMALPMVPADVFMEVGVGFLFCWLGQMGAMGTIRPLTSGGQLAAPSYRTRDFDTYNHRMQALRK